MSSKVVDFHYPNFFQIFVFKFYSKHVINFQIVQLIIEFGAKDIAKYLKEIYSK